MPTIRENFDKDLSKWDVYESEGTIALSGGNLITDRTGFGNQDWSLGMISKKKIPIHKGTLLAARFKTPATQGWPQIKFSFADTNAFGPTHNDINYQGFGISNNDHTMQCMELGSGQVENFEQHPLGGMALDQWYFAFSRFKIKDGKLKLFSWCAGPGIVGIQPLGNNSRDVLTEGLVNPLTEAYVMIDHSNGPNSTAEVDWIYANG